MRDDRISKKTVGVLSASDDVPEWALEYAKSPRFIYTIYKPRKREKLSASQIKAWIKTLEAAEGIFLRVEPFLRYRDDILIDPISRQCTGTGLMLKLLREAQVFLKEFLDSGRPWNKWIAHAVYGLSKLYEEKTGKPNYRQVGFIIAKVFSLKNVGEEDWAQKQLPVTPSL